MKSFKNIGLIVFLFVICFGFFSVKAQSIGTIYSPLNGTSYYRGEVINYKAVVTNHETVAKTPYALITKDNSKEEVYKEFIGMVPGETQTLAGSFPTKNIKAGSYYFVILMMNTYNPYANVQKGDLISTKITIKDLSKPKGVKAVAKKKKIKITYNAVKGATKYNIYRSKKKSKGYKLIGSTTKTKFKDKKAKKGKTYYYKVQSVRTVNGTLTSKYSKKVYAVRY